MDSSFVFTPYTLGYAVSLAIAVTDAVVSWQRRQSPRGMALFFLMTAASIWIFFGMLEVSATSVNTKILLSQLEYIGGVTTPVLFLVFAAVYGGFRHWVRPRYLLIAFIIPALTLVLATTNSTHHLVWAGFSAIDPDSNLMVYEHGPWFWFANAGYSTLCLLAGSLIIIRSAFQTSKEYRPSAILLLSGVAVPWLAGMIYVSGFNPFPGYDLTRIGVAFSGIMFLLAIYGRHLLDITPIARNIIIDTIPDGMLVLDRKKRIIDINRAARDMIGTDAQTAIGKPLVDLISTAPWLSSVTSSIETSTSMCLITGTDRHLEASISVLRDSLGQSSGRIVLLRDITERQISQEAIRRSEELYRSLFDNMINGFAFCRLTYENGKPADFTFLEVNPAFGRLTGLADVSGKQASALMPAFAVKDITLLEMFARVSATGRAEKMETYIHSLNMWLDIAVYSTAREHFVAVFDVVTERIQLESRLRAAATDWETTFNSIRDAISIHDGDYNIIRVNQAFAELVGRPVEAIINHKCYDIVHGLQAPLPGCPHTCTMSECRQVSSEFFEPALCLYVEITTSPIVEPDGRCTGSVHVIKDISARKETELALRENEARLSSLFQSMSEGVALHQLVMNEAGDPVDYRIVDVNPKFEEIIGLKREQVVNRLATDAYGVAAPPYLAQYSRVALSGKPGHLSVYFEPLDKHFDISIAPWGDGGFATIFTDVTEQMRIWETKSRLAAIVEFSADALIGRGRDGRITSWNRAAEHMLGYSAEEMIGRTNDILIPPDMDNEVPERLREIDETGRTVKWETRRRRKDGTIIDVAVTISPIRDTEGRVTGYSTIARDITESNRSRERLKSALAEKELLLKEIHHRVKNNMQVISSLLKMQGQFVNDESTRAMLQESQERIKSMSLVYNKLYQSSDLACIGMKEYVPELVTNLVHAYATSPDSVKPELDVDDVTFDIDTAIPLGLVINELVTNAMKYAFPSGRRGKILVSLKRLDAGSTGFRLVVRDNGVGLPEDFDPLTNRSLGMRLVNALARHQLGGTVELLRDGGTEFIITFEKG
ncbi:signal transduction histidine kinase [Dehalogenimonas lykanthroporepellens BL-DC-9]|nr:signal transduction histidine kinase [Dehalogenimonas lykanthroporepellens BL-DC-9]